MRVVLRDIGLLTQSHAGGVFGPQDIATASLGVVDFAGWVEMGPSAEVAWNGGPVILVEVKVCETGVWPGAGFAADLVDVFENLLNLVRNDQALDRFSAIAPDSVSDAHGEPEPEMRGGCVSASAMVLNSA